jgi:hypothetical protein
MNIKYFKHGYKTTCYIKYPANELSILLALQSLQDLSDTFIAQDLGISHAYFSRIKSGHRLTTPTIMGKMF